MRLHKDAEETEERKERVDVGREASTRAKENERKGKEREKRRNKKEDISEKLVSRSH